MFAVPVAYELFRMGYYATVVPNTALAKDAGGLHLGQGWAYLTDFAAPYRLWVSATLIVAAMVLAYLVRRDRRVAVATVAMVAAALADVVYIVAIGGDYMHGRLLLPAFFAFGLPASIVLRRDTAIMATVAGLAAVWALVSVVWFRPPPLAPGKGLGPAPISDWRTVSGASMKPADFALGLNGTQAAAAYARGVRGYFTLTDKTPRTGRNPDAFVLTLGSIGVPAYDAGPQVWVIDIGGLAEPLAARTAAIPGRQAGHRKQIDTAWYDARFGGPSTDRRVLAARHALTCGPGAALIQAVDGDLTPGRFWSNMWHSISETRLRVPSDPIVAERRWC